MYVVLEGIDGSGKDRVIVELVRLIPGDVVILHEPTYRVRAIAGEFEDRRALVHLFTADRIEHAKYVRKLLDSGKKVLQSRCFVSTLVYQAEPDERERVLELTEPALRLARPDAIILVDVEPEVARARLKRDRFERKRSERRLEELRNRYREAMRRLSSRGFETFSVPADSEPGAVAARILEELQRREILRFFMSFGKYLEILSRGFDEILSRKPDVEGFQAELERFYEGSLSRGFSPGDALLVGLSPSLRLAFNAGLMIYDRILLLDFAGYLTLETLRSAARGSVDADSLEALYAFIESLKSVEEYSEFLAVLPHRAYLRVHRVFDPRRRFEEELSEDRRLRAFYEFVLRKASGFVPRYYFEGLVVAQALGASTFTTDPRVILGLRGLGAEHIDVASDGISERYLLAAKHLGVLEARRLMSAVASMGVEELREIRSKFPPRKVRKSLAEYEPELPREASAASFALPAASLAAAVFPGLAAIVAVIESAQNIAELARSVVGIIKRRFSGAGFVTKFYEEIPRIAGEFRKKPLFARLREAIRKIFHTRRPRRPPGLRI